MAKTRHCKDCPEKVKRPCPYPGPRCATHHRAFIRKQKLRSHTLMVQKTYGLAEGEYQLLHKTQEGFCAICRRAKGISKRLAVDHDHKTGKVRGLLCSVCNQFIGYVGDDPEAGKRIYVYLGGI